MSVRFLEDLNVDGNLDSGQLSVNHNAGALNMVGTDHTYMQWYPAGLSGGRHAYTGFAGGGTNHFTIANETSGANINLTTSSGTVNVTGNLSVSGTVDGVDIGANYANWNTAYGWGDHASAGYLLKSGGTMTGTLKAATLEGASFTNRFRKMSVLPGGYIEPNALNFRFDESQTAYAGEAHGIGGTISQTSGTTIPDASLKRLFTFTSSYINLNTYKDASNNVVVELTNIALSNSANTSWRPYVFFHSAAGNVASMTIELKDGDNNWETVENAIDCVDFYMYDGFYTLSPGILRGARFTFTNITGNSYLRMIGVIGKTVEPYQWNVLKSGSKMFGDLDFADSKKATFGNSGDLDLLHDGSNSYIHHNGAGSLYMKADTGDINIINYTNDRDITLQSDNGSGGTTPYITLDGSVVETKFNKDLRVIDNEKIIAGTSNDLEIFSTGADAVFKTWSGDMIFQQNANDKDIIFQSDNSAGGVAEYFKLDGSLASGSMLITKWPDNSRIALGSEASQGDLNIYHNATDSFINNYTGDLYIKNNANDKDIIFQSDDGSGGTAEYFRLDGGYTSPYTVFPDNSTLCVGNGLDLRFLHNGSNSFIDQTGTGDLYIRQKNNDRDIILQSDDGSGGTTAYLTLDGSETKTIVSQTMEFQDNVKLAVGNSEDLIIDHNATDSRVINYTGDLRIVNSANDKDITLESDDGSGGITPYLTLDGSTTHSYFSAGNVGIGTTSPQRELHVHATNYTDIQLTNDTTGAGAGDGSTISATGNDLYINNKESGSLLLLTNNSERVRVTSSGNVGIGTTSPDTLLEVSKSTGAAVRITSTATGNGADVTLGSLEYYGNDASVPGAGIKSSIVAKTEASLGDDSNLIFSTSDGTTNNIERLRINSSGNVGIGTTNPTVGLQLGNSTLGQTKTAIFNSEGGSEVGLTIKSRTNRAKLRVADNDSNAYVVAEAGKAFFGASANGDTNNITVLTSGNVGIGTTSPTSKLHISESASASTADLLYLQNTGSGGNEGVSIIFNPMFSATSMIASNREGFGSNATNLSFHTCVVNGDPPIERMRIASSGNVGIGTTSPDSTLDVNGAITLSGSSNEIIKSNGSIRLNIDSDNNQGDRIFIVSTGSNSELFRVDEGGHGEFQGNATVNGSIELGHASDTTIARASAGKVTIEGAPIQTTQMSMSHHNFYFNTSSTTIDYFVPFNSLTESSNPTITNYYGRMVAPYDGKIVKAVINTTAAIGTACSAQFWVATSSGVFAPSPAETVSNINLNTANTAATATFSGTSTAEFSEGDVVGLSIQKSGTTSTAYIQVTIVWEYTV